VQYATKVMNKIQMVSVYLNLLMKTMIMKDLAKILIMALKIRIMKVVKLIP